MNLDPELQDALEALGAIDEPTKAEWEAERIEVETLCANLEAKYADRGLKFTVPFNGAVPVQAYGIVDGLRFYFRYRHGHASFKAGPYNADIENAIHARDVFRDKRDAAKRAAAEPGSFDYHYRWATDIPQSDDRDYYPMEIHEYAGVEYGDEYDGYLDHEEMFNVFSMLMDQEPTIVPEADRIAEYYKTLMTGVDPYTKEVFDV